MNSNVIELWINDAEYQAVRSAAEDAHMDIASYCRLMVLCAAGMGGALEHIERVVAASAKVDATTMELVLPRPISKKPAPEMGHCQQCDRPLVLRNGRVPRHKNLSRDSYCMGSGQQPEHFP